MVIILFVAGLVLLIVGAEALVKGSSRLAAAAGISPLVIGLTVVAFGTSSPELAVSVNSALAGQADIALGPVIGSNIFNVTLQNNLFRNLHDPVNVTATGSVKADPMFDSINVSKGIFDFHFRNSPASPAVNKGVPTSFTKDLDDLPRAVGLPDLGCYERQ